MPQFIVVIDVETTGVDPFTDSIIQLSAIKYFGNKEVDRLNTYLNPGYPIPSDAISIHKITDDTVKGAPKICDLKNFFLDFVNDSVFVGYNVSFDLSFINVAYDNAIEGAEYIDVMLWAKKYLNLPNYRLGTVAEYLGFHPIGDFHNALTDCEATADIFWKLCMQELLHNSHVFCAPKQKKKKSFDTFRPKEIIPRATPTDTSHPLYGKKIVFTGELAIGRHEAAQKAVDVGACIKSGVSSKTNYLVVGTQDPTVVGTGGTSGKEKKAYELNISGKASIKIIGEHEFMLLLEGGV